MFKAFLTGLVGIIGFSQLGRSNDKSGPITWETYCISTKEAVGEQVIKMEVKTDKLKWNRYLSEQGSLGWEPIQFLYVPDRNSTPIMTACFKRQRPTAVP